jgi:hypothetical protein
MIFDLYGVILDLNIVKGLVFYSAGFLGGFTIVHFFREGKVLGISFRPVSYWTRSEVEVRRLQTE